MQNKLQELKALHEQGLITDEVYAEQQKAIVSSHLSAEEKPTATAPEPPLIKPKVARPLWQQLLMAAFVVLAGIWILYQVSDRKGKDVINQLASETGIGTQVIPWSDRADTVLRTLIPQNQKLLAEAIQGITHPTGTAPQFDNFTVSKLDGRVQVEISVTWKGGFVGNRYKTAVLWEISESNHVSAKVTSDSAMTEINPKNKEALDDFFRAKVYPAFYRSISGTHP